MPMPMKLIFIHGAPASGKLTVGKALQKIVRAKLFDNHAAIDFAKSVLDFGAPGFWELVHSAKITALDAAVRNGVPILISTGCYSEPEDRRNFEEGELIVKRDGGYLLPVFLSCSDTIREQRVCNPDRVERQKMASVEGLRKFNREWNIAPVPRDNCLHLDSGQTEPEVIAAKIVKHFALAHAGPA